MSSSIDESSKLRRPQPSNLSGANLAPVGPAFVIPVLPADAVLTMGKRGYGNKDDKEKAASVAICAAADAVESECVLHSSVTHSAVQVSNPQAPMRTWRASTLCRLHFDYPGPA